MAFNCMLICYNERETDDEVMERTGTLPIHFSKEFSSKKVLLLNSDKAKRASTVGTPGKQHSYNSRRGSQDKDGGGKSTPPYRNRVRKDTAQIISKIGNASSHSRLHGKSKSFSGRNTIDDGSPTVEQTAEEITPKKKLPKYKYYGNIRTKESPVSDTEEKRDTGLQSSVHKKEFYRAPVAYRPAMMPKPGARPVNVAETNLVYKHSPTVTTHAKRV